MNVAWEIEPNLRESIFLVKSSIQFRTRRRKEITRRNREELPSIKIYILRNRDLILERNPRDPRREEKIWRRRPPKRLSEANYVDTNSRTRHIGHIDPSPSNARMRRNCNGPRSFNREIPLFIPSFSWDHTRNAQQKEISITGDDPGNWNRNWNREWSVTYELSIPRCLSSLGSSNLIWNLGNHFIRNLGSFRSPFPRIFLVSLSLSRFIRSLCIRRECHSTRWTSTINICFCINEMESGRIRELIGRNVLGVLVLD